MRFRAGCIASYGKSRDDWMPVMLAARTVTGPATSLHARHTGLKAADRFEVDAGADAIAVSMPVAPANARSRALKSAVPTDHPIEERRPCQGGVREDDGDVGADSTQ